MTARAEAERAIADVLFKHRFGPATYTSGGQRLPDRCECWKFKGGVEAHRAHVASLLADLMAERQAEAWAAGYRKGADDHYQCGDTCKVPTEAPNPYRPDPKDTRDE